jgi:hypothetical protein
MFQKTWTPEEERYLTYRYCSKGPVFCSKKLKRPINAVRLKAKRMGLEFGQTQPVMLGRYMLVNDVIAEADCPPSTLWTRIRREKVAQHYGIEGKGNRSKRSYVPREWAEAFIADYKELVFNAHNYSHYLSLQEAAKRLGITKSALSHWVTGKSRGMSRYLKGCHYVYALNGNGGQNRLLFNPLDIDKAVRLMDEDKAQVSGWEAMKSLEQDIPANQSLIKKVARRIAKPRKAFHHGSWRLYVSPEDAAKIRQHFDVRQAA